MTDKTFNKLVELIESFEIMKEKFYKEYQEAYEIPNVHYTVRNEGFNIYRDKVDALAKEVKRLIKLEYSKNGESEQFKTLVELIKTKSLYLSSAFISYMANMVDTTPLAVNVILKTDNEYELKSILEQEGLDRKQLFEACRDRIIADTEKSIQTKCVFDSSLRYNCSLLYNEFASKDDVIYIFECVCRADNTDAFEFWYLRMPQDMKDDCIDIAIKNSSAKILQRYQSSLDVAKLKIVREKLGYTHAYEKFLDSHTIENVPTLDTIAQFYLRNYDKLKELTDEEIYAYFVDYKEMPKGANSLGDWDVYNILSRIKDNGKRMSERYEAQESRGFMQIGQKHNMPEIRNSCKLWINTNSENLQEWEKLFIGYFKNIFTTGIQDHTEVKFCINAQRNDIITIYADYKYIDDLLKFLQLVKSERPELFETPSKANPLIPTLDGIVSYADVGSSTSYPSMISKILEFLNKCDIDINASSKKETFELTKNLILEYLAKCYGQPDFKKLPNFPNVNNLASVRGSDNVHPFDLHESEIKKLIENLRKQQTFAVDKYIKEDIVSA